MDRPQRITLSRVIAINWYGFRRIIDLNGLALLCGENGTGKSALLDLVQFVLLGSKGTRFNRAATGDGKRPTGRDRDLRGYCLCDTNTKTQDGQPRYLRPSGVTLAALEFEWPAEEGAAEPRRETWGVRVEYEGPTSDARYVWFYTPCRLHWSDITREADLTQPGKQELLPEDEFRVRVKRDLQGDYFGRLETYLEEMGAREHLFFDRTQMNKTLPGAIAFQPVENFEQFIRDNILEPGLPEVREVRRSLDALREAERRVDTLGDQLGYLQRIREHHLTFSSARREEALFGHLRAALDHAEAEEKFLRAGGDLLALRDKHAEDKLNMANAVSERDQVKSRYDEVKLVAGRDDSLRKLSDLRRQREDLKPRIERLRLAARTAHEMLNQRAQHWEEWLRYGQRVGLNAKLERADLLSELRHQDAHVGLEALPGLAREYDRISRLGEDWMRPKKEELDDLEQAEMDLQRQLVSLSEGRTQATPLLDNLRSRGHKADLFARVVEVKPEFEAWWPLLESVLGPLRHTVIIEDGSYLAAWEQFQKITSTELLANMDEIRALNPEAAKGSLATMLETKNSDAQLLINHWLGQIIAVSSTDKLKLHDRAVTQEGILKEPGLRRHVSIEKELTLGEEGLRRMREEREEEMERVRGFIADYRREVHAVRGWLQRGQEYRLGEDAPKASASELAQLPALETNERQLEETIQLLATPEQERQLQEMDELEMRLRRLEQRIGALTTAVTEFAVNERILTELVDSSREEFQTATLSLHESLNRLPRGLSQDEISAALTAALQSGGSWQKRKDQADYGRQSAHDRAERTRRDRNDERSKLAEAHQEYRYDFDIEDDDNARYDARCNDLETHGLSHYRKLAEERRREWEERLQSQVLDVLREKIDDATRTIRELSKILDQDIGRYRYRISQTRDRAQSAMWGLLENGVGFNSSDVLFAASHQDEINKAKEELMAAIDNPDDPKAQRLLDYRFYHRYDMLMIPSGHSEEAAISLQNNARKMSGGENQAPFFVSMLAAFHRVYDLGRKDARKNLGLVVMDEAFSKLSGDRIDDCLALARNFGLQLLLAFPMDRLGTMIEHADTVIECRVDRKRDGQGRDIHIENWVVPWNKDKLLQALAG
ncbi:Uncharacterized protein YPO0396 [Prosthecobacter debontii]|uniref:Uncharacterized protein YPO0396 n=1 Tax=Prosthecobacter debontii TaxID=48467 RepID=A0A1T4WR60_9BACT|nr:SbcC/MukB-like Walker B domain-containing protein [Prosthecobacter debontii]SKA79844.1 Uncharacterized protein YPO0396 [Prosthecobacter debontii]